MCSSNATLNGLPLEALPNRTGVDNQDVRGTAMSHPAGHGAHSRQWLAAAGILALMIASVIPIWAGLQTRMPTDDAYITMVYARSVVSGQGFRFYPGAPPTLGTTSPLQALLLALVWKLFPLVPPEGSVIALSVLWWVGSGWLLAWQGRSLGFTRPESLCAGVMVLLGALPDPNQSLGMEVRLFTVLLTATVILYAQKRFFWAGITLGLLCLTRAEGILLLGALPLYELLKLRGQQPWERKQFVTLGHQAWRLAAGFLIAVGPWTLYGLVSIGTVIPDTLAAKSYQLRLGFVPFVPRFIHDFLALAFDLGTIQIGWLKISLWAIISVIAAIIKSYQLRPYAILAIWALAYFVGYTLTGVPFYYWYLVPFLYVMTIFLGCGMAALGSFLGSVARRRMQRTTNMLNVLAWQSAGIGLLLAVACLRVVSVSGDVNFVDARWSSYTRISEWLKTNTPPGSRIGYMETGMIAWYSDRPIIDLLGLTEPQLIPYLASGAVVTSFQAAQPDYFLYNDIFRGVLGPIIVSDDFGKNYRLIAQVNGDNPSVWPVTSIYRRN